MSILVSILAAVAVPHPPLIFPEVGHGREQQIEKTIESYRHAMKFLASYKPDTVILVSPHTEVYADYFHVSGGFGSEGNFAAFGAPQVKVRVEYDHEFVTALELACSSQNFACGTKGERDPALDHGSLIPLKFLNEVWTDYKVVRIGISGLSLSQHYKLGQIIRSVAEDLGRRTVFIASGDLSHKLLDDGPYGFAPEGPVFDARITKDLDQGDFGDLLEFEPQFCDAAGECGHRSFVMMAGALDGKAVESKLLSYEGPFGVGYGVAEFAVKGEDENRRFGESYAEKKKQKIAALREKEDGFVSFARRCVEAFVKTGKKLEFPDDLPEELLNNKAGAFVTLKINGVLRGCIGTIEPVRENLAREIWHNAVSACSEDPRFKPVRPDELDDIVYSVDVLTPARPVTDITSLNPKVDGIIVQNGNRRGLLLPDLDGIDTVEQQIAIARQKAGIAPSEPVNMFSFQVERHH